jgi:hypothetical protein
MAKGIKTGGRKKGVPNKVTLRREKEIAASGLTPLEYMLAVMRNPRADPARRDDMAKAAAPFVHPKLASVDHRGRIGVYDLSRATDEQLDRLEAILSPLADAGGDPGGAGEAGG